MSMDAWQERQITQLRDRNANALRENAERIREHVGYVLARIDGGHPEATGLYAQDIAASAERMRLAVAAIETLDETLGILATAVGNSPPEAKAATR
jgi:hypothetical protein